MKNQLLRHILSTIAYRLSKVTENAPAEFGVFSIGKDRRTPEEVLNHMGHVVHATQIFVAEERFEKKSPPQLDWSSEVERFNEALRNLDAAFADAELPVPYSKRLIQGPLSDVLSHVGQLAMLRGLAGAPIPGEDYSAAAIETGMK